MIERMLADHARLRACADCLERLLSSPALPDMDALAEARWALGSAMMQHLAFEERHLYAHLNRDPRPHVRRIAASFQADLASSFAPYAEHAKQWTPERVAARWDDYRSRTRKLLETMHVRMARVEAALYPLVTEHAIDTSESAPPTQNWTREAFAIKARIVGR